jgi:hypothetical protein
MGQISRLLPVAAFFLALVAALDGCGGSSPVTSPPPLGYIAMAMRSSEGQSWGLSVFPQGAGTRKCVIRGGGPPPGILVPGTCSSSVVLRGNDEALVRFVERWNARDFHADSGGRQRLSHTWEITISLQGKHVVASRDYGDFPPQLVR